ncbi:MAG: LacI family transcriptional regulator, repressor for deo operon, udp, cdd, tsx, nupC, and nupG [Kosmotogales bacterium]|nr:LacI family transcriptional regulator, repressor for deo operon, udp, cdd, tsx, nupC, and nupG [Kosmotogales bacterium]
MSTTLKDISEKTGFSTSTVSRALKNDPRISEETKTKIFSIARTLGYRFKNNFKHNKVIMFFVSNPHESIESDEFFSIVQRGILESATEKNVNCLIQSIPLSENFDNSIIPLDLIQGIIVGGIPMPNSMKSFLLNIDVPVVLIGKYSGLEKFPSVNNDNMRGGYLAAAELIKKGYEDIFIITGPTRVSTFSDRIEGFMKCFKESSISTKNIRIIEQDNFDERAGKEAVIKNLFKKKTDRTAIFCTTDWLAKGALEGLNILKIKVPEQIGLLGFGGLSFCNHLTPKLSTISLNPYLLGRIAFLLLDDLLNEKNEGRGSIFVEPTSTMRETLIGRKLK